MGSAEPFDNRDFPVPNDRFIFQSYAFDASQGSLRLHYAFASGEAFEEVLTFPLCSHALTRAEEEALDRVFRLIFLLAGVSYYKAKIPSCLLCEAFPFDQDTARFVQETYFHGLGEFSYRNKVELDFHIECEDVPSLMPMTLPRSDKLLVPIGGGKDSIVTIEALRKTGADVTLFALGSAAAPAGPIAATIEQSGLPFLYVKRVLSPKLIELNDAGALNGHVPITAILSVIALACAIMQGQGAVVLSNEHSASAPNVFIEGRQINHQYSKSFAFEKALAAYVHTHVSPDLDYFSLLRPLSETAIARRFAQHESYHSLFRSCNTAFRQDEAKRGTHWCCDCPKCRFVFLALAPFMEKEKLVSIFGRDMLDDERQLEGFQELCGLSSHKPFECVGEVEESALLMGHLAHMEAWKDDFVVAALGKPLYNEARFEALFAQRQEHLIPQELWAALDETI
ncbi:MAG: endonuclease domain-containing protein [Bdellovibrionales bacterium]